MGWGITIGNAVIAPNDEDSTMHLLTVEDASHPDAPEWPTNEGDWPDISGKTNYRAPSYSGFASWLAATGLADKVAAFDARGSNGDVYILRPEERDSVSDARERWERTHPGAVPGWDKSNDGTLARLIWYEWWMTWALANCERPAIRMC
jgi:hypothetical protein